MNRAEAIKIMESIKEECAKHEDWKDCKGCPFRVTFSGEENEETECVLDTHFSMCDSPGNIDYKKIMSEG